MTGSHISLFSGVGMTDLAAQSLGYETIATAEIDPWNRKLLGVRFPDALHFADVRRVEGTHTMLDSMIQRPLLISGGFPCQDVYRRQRLMALGNGLVPQAARIALDTLDPKGAIPA